MKKSLSELYVEINTLAYEACCNAIHRQLSDLPAEYTDDERIIGRQAMLAGMLEAVTYHMFYDDCEPPTLQ